MEDNDFIDSIIDSNNEETESPQGNEEQDLTPDEANGDDESVETDDVPFPKKAENAIARRDKKINKLKAQINDYNQRLLQLENLINSQNQQSNAPKPPKMEDYEEYEDYLLDRVKFETQGKKQEKPLDPEEIKAQAYEQAKLETFIAQKNEDIAKMSEVYKKQIPDFDQVVEEWGDAVEELPESILEAFYHLDNPTIAFYNLAKTGKLEDLANLSPARAAIELAKAEIQGLQYVQSRQNNISKAKPPIRGVNGGGGVKTLDNMSPQEMLDWVNS